MLSLDETIELASGGVDASIAHCLDVRLNMPRGLGGEEDYAGWVRHQRRLQHEAREVACIGEVHIDSRRPTLADVHAFCESGVERAKVIGKSAMMDTEGFAVWNGRVEDRPLILQHTAVSRAVCQEIAYFYAFAASSE